MFCSNLLCRNLNMNIRLLVGSRSKHLITIIVTSMPASLMKLTIKSRKAIPCFGITTHYHCGARADELGAMIQILPEGEERDYLAATSEVVEALNLYNWGVREIIQRAHSQDLIHSFNDPTANHAAEYQKELGTRRRSLAQVR